MKPQKVLFIDTAHAYLTQGLQDLGYVCDYFEDFGREELKNIVENYQGLVVRSKVKLDADFLAKAVQLKFIARVGAGMENIDTEFCIKKGIHCLNAPEGNRDAVGEHALAMLLMLFNNLKRADDEVRKGIWVREANRGVELGGKTIGIIGYGNTGGAFARKLSGFDVSVLAYDKYKSIDPDEFVEAVDLATIYEKSDVVSLHIPLNDETTYLANTSFFNSFKKPIYFINTSRGKVLKTADLLTAFRNSKVKGACLDVLEYEGMSFEALKTKDLPKEYRELVTRDDVILSPHIAGWTHESALKMAETLVSKIKNLS